MAVFGPIWRDAQRHARSPLVHLVSWTRWCGAVILLETRSSRRRAAAKENQTKARKTRKLASFSFTTCCPKLRMRYVSTPSHRAVLFQPEGGGRGVVWNLVSALLFLHGEDHIVFVFQVLSAGTTHCQLQPTSAGSSTFACSAGNHSSIVLCNPVDRAWDKKCKSASHAGSGWHKFPKTEMQNCHLTRDVPLLIVKEMPVLAMTDQDSRP
ncbi:hypothetical protein VTK26DRAFT_6791 [Humicola hyalothermophila]